MLLSSMLSVCCHFMSQPKLCVLAPLARLLHSFNPTVCVFACVLRVSFLLYSSTACWKFSISLKSLTGE